MQRTTTFVYAVMVSHDPEGRSAMVVDKMFKHEVHARSYLGDGMDVRSGLRKLTAFPLYEFDVVAAAEEEKKSTEDVLKLLSPAQIELLEKHFSKKS